MICTPNTCRMFQAAHCHICHSYTCLGFASLIIWSTSSRPYLSADDLTCSPFLFSCLNRLEAVFNMQRCDWTTKWHEKIISQSDSVRHWLKWVQHFKFKADLKRFYISKSVSRLYVRRLYKLSLLCLRRELRKHWWTHLSRRHLGLKKFENWKKSGDVEEKNSPLFVTLSSSSYNRSRW